MRALDYLWLIPALPFLGAAVNGLVVRNRDQLAAQMKPAEIEEAHRRAREWRPK